MKLLRGGGTQLNDVMDPLFCVAKTYSVAKSINSQLPFLMPTILSLALALP